MAKRIVRLTEADMNRLVKRIIKEQDRHPYPQYENIEDHPDYPEFRRLKNEYRRNVRKYEQEFLSDAEDLMQQLSLDSGYPEDWYMSKFKYGTGAPRMEPVREPKYLKPMDNPIYPEYKKLYDRYREQVDPIKKEFISNARDIMQRISTDMGYDSRWLIERLYFGGTEMSDNAHQQW
jgi:hypothetical protein